MATLDWEPLSNIAQETTARAGTHIPGFPSSPAGANSSDKENEEEFDSYPQKRALEDGDLPSSKKSRAIVSSNGPPPKDFVIPEPHEMPPITHNDGSKPPYSYATLIGMALLRSPERKLTLAEIYDWITLHFSYYDKDTKGWKNSIRHNLSLNKSFQKTEKSNGKKGHFWKILPGCEYDFCNLKANKRSNTASNGGKKSKKAMSNDEPSSSDNETYSRPVTSSEMVIPSTPVSKYSSTFDYANDMEGNDTTGLTPKSSPFNFKTPIHHINTLQSSPIVRNDHPANPVINLFDSPYALNHTPNDKLLLPPHASATMPNSSGSNESLDFTCSFSSSNIEMSPLGPILDQGPILEPITPQRCQQQKSLQLPSIHQQLNNTLSTGFKTPQLQHHTPLNKKVWASPSYLEDFMNSPMVGKNSIISPQQQRRYQYGHNSSLSGSNVLKGLGLGSSGSSGNGYSSNEIFGIDICSINNHHDV